MEVETLFPAAAAAAQGFPPGDYNQRPSTAMAAAAGPWHRSAFHAPPHGPFGAAFLPTAPMAMPSSIGLDDVPRPTPVRFAGLGSSPPPAFMLRLGAGSQQGGTSLGQYIGEYSCPAGPCPFTEPMCSSRDA